MSSSIRNIHAVKNAAILPVKFCQVSLLKCHITSLASTPTASVFDTAEIEVRFAPATTAQVKLVLYRQTFPSVATAHTESSPATATFWTRSVSAFTQIQSFKPHTQRHSSFSLVTHQIFSERAAICPQTRGSRSHIWLFTLTTPVQSNKQEIILEIETISYAVYLIVDGWTKAESYGYVRIFGNPTQKFLVDYRLYCVILLWCSKGLILAWKWHD